MRTSKIDVIDYLHKIAATVPTRALGLSDEVVWPHVNLAPRQRAFITLEGTIHGSSSSLKQGGYLLIDMGTISQISKTNLGEGHAHGLKKVMQKSCTFFMGNRLLGQSTSQEEEIKDKLLVIFINDESLVINIHDCLSDNNR